MSDTNIEWADKVWNPVRGCSKISPGCANCYAMHVAARFSGPGQPYEGLAKRDPTNWTGAIRLVPEKLAGPLTWKRPCRVFVNSMSDLFHEDVPDEFIDRVFGVMAKAYWHTFQVLTKRADRMARYFTGRDSHLAMTRQFVNFREYTEPVGPWPLPNVMLGVSVEDQDAADERIPHLLNTPAAVRFLSVEPLLGPIRLTSKGYIPATGDHPEMYGFMAGPDDGKSVLSKTREEALARSGIGWVIVGGESGKGARPCDIAWIRSVVDQCKAAGVPVFVKQLGSRPVETFVEPDGWLGPYNAWEKVELRDRKGGDMEEWDEDLRVREFPRQEQPA